MPTESTKPMVNKLSDTIIEQFQPIVAEFGFTKPSWDYSSDLDIVRVQFDDPRSEKALQIDCNPDYDSCSANYCRIKGDWQVCAEGKQKDPDALRVTLPRWIRRHCGECRTREEEMEESYEW